MAVCVRVARELVRMRRTWPLTGAGRPRFSVLLVRPPGMFLPIASLIDRVERKLSALDRKPGRRPPGSCSSASASGGSARDSSAWALVALGAAPSASAAAMALASSRASGKKPTVLTANERDSVPSSPSRAERLIRVIPEGQNKPNHTKH